MTSDNPFETPKSHVTAGTWPRPLVVFAGAGLLLLAEGLVLAASGARGLTLHPGVLGALVAGAALVSAGLRMAARATRWEAALGFTAFAAPQLPVVLHLAGDLILLGELNLLQVGIQAVAFTACGGVGTVIGRLLARRGQAARSERGDRAA